MDTRDLQGETLTNTVIGATAAILVAFIPILNVFSSAIGAGLAAHLQNEGVGGGLKMGVTVTLVFMIPVGLLFVVASGLIAPVIPFGASTVGGVGLFVVLVLSIPTVILAMLGGAVGGAIR